MKLLHLADLHFGKSIHGVSLMENGDQPVWTDRFLKAAREIHPDAVLIAGDVYDRSAPSGDAVALLDRMVTALSEMGIAVMMVAGNHDSGQRLAFGSSLLAKQNIHIAGVLSKEVPHITLSDPYGPVTFWLMPYIFPALAAQVLEDDSIHDYDTAFRRLLAVQDIDFSQRNVLVAHQNITANGQEAVRGGSESMVGGIGQIDYTAFDGFEYAALGHIHSAYPVGRQTVRYAGSPLCYHFEETKQPAKGPVLVELGAKGKEVLTETITIAPLHPMREIKGTYHEIQSAELQNTSQGEYIRIVLTDRRPTPEIYNFFHSLLDNRGSILMELVSEYQPFHIIDPATATHMAEEKAIEDLFMDFYSGRCDAAPGQQEQELLRFAGELVRHTDATADTDLLERQSKAVKTFALGQEENK